MGIIFYNYLIKNTDNEEYIGRNMEGTQDYY